MSTPLTATPQRTHHEQIPDHHKEARQVVVQLPAGHGQVLNADRSAHCDMTRPLVEPASEAQRGAEGYRCARSISILERDERRERGREGETREEISKANARRERATFDECVEGEAERDVNM